MILDTSAIVSVLREELGHEDLLTHLAGSAICRIGAPTQVESEIVLTRLYGIRGHTILARFMQEFEVDVIPFGVRHSSVARDAYVRFGKGRHPAALNLGDCFTYATAYVAGEPLLCVGNDFAQTDLELVA